MIMRDGKSQDLSVNLLIKSAATYCDAKRFIGIVVKGRYTSQTVDETMLPRRRANESQPSHCDTFPTGRVVSVL